MGKTTKLILLDSLLQEAIWQSVKIKV